MRTTMALTNLTSLMQSSFALRPASFQHIFQDERGVVRLVGSAIDQRNLVPPAGLLQLTDGSLILAKLAAVLLLELAPLCRVVAEPLSQFRTRPTSLSQSSTAAASFVSPRGQRRSTNTRKPSPRVGFS